MNITNTIIRKHGAAQMTLETNGGNLDCCALFRLGLYSSLDAIDAKEFLKSKKLNPEVDIWKNKTRIRWTMPVGKLASK